MENPGSAHFTQSPRAVLWVSPGLKDAWAQIPSAPATLPQEQAENAPWRLDTRDGRLRLQHSQENIFLLPNTPANLRFLAEQVARRTRHGNARLLPPRKPFLEIAAAASPLFTPPGGEAGLRSFLEKLSSTISLKNALDGLLSLRAFAHHAPGVLLVHQKGEASAWQIGFSDDDSRHTRSISIGDFNLLFTAATKTKHGQFTTQTPKWSWLPFSGSFMAEVFRFQRFNVVLVATRWEFLPFNPEEVERFHHFSRLIGLWLPGLVESEFSDLRMAEVMLLLDRSPIPLVIRDPSASDVFTNAAWQSFPPADARWLSLGGGYQLGLGKGDQQDNARFDVLHGHKVALLGDLFNTLGHELSNPLFGLGLAAEILLASAPDDDSEIMLTAIRENVKRCQLILQNLTRLYSEQGLDAVCDARTAIREALTLAKSELKAVRQDARQATEGEAVWVEGRPVLVVQILFNLLVNAAQAMRESTNKPCIRITLQSNDDQVIIGVSDNGPGLPASIRENLFRPFATTKAHGHGLGLALSRQLARQAGGDLELGHEEVGASFQLFLKKKIS